MKKELDIFDLYKLVLSFFDKKASLPSLAETDKEVECVLYDSFVFKCSLDDRYGYFGAGIMIDKDHLVCNILGRQLTMLGNSEEDILKSLELVDQYCQLRLPDKYLEAFFITGSIN